MLQTLTGKMISAVYLAVVTCLFKHTSGFTPAGCDLMANAFQKLERAEKIIKSAKEKVSNNMQSSLPLDCGDLFKNGEKNSGVYSVWPNNRIFAGSISVYCDMETDGGGWTENRASGPVTCTVTADIYADMLQNFVVPQLQQGGCLDSTIFMKYGAPPHIGLQVIQRRGDFGRSKNYFYRDWQTYKEGFGNLEEDFWFGNDKIYALSNQKLYSARFDLGDVEGNKRYAVYDTFWIDNEDNNYTLHILGYRGNAGNALRIHNGQKFSTKDRDNDTADNSCAEFYKAAWWYRKCHDSSLNGEYRPGKIKDKGHGLNWTPWTGSYESLATTEIKIRKNPSWIK